MSTAGQPGHDALLKSERHTFIRWREFDRAMQVNAFTLRLDDGTTVRVVPDASVYLVDDLVKGENVEHDHRVRRVSLDHEERAFVTGVLRVDRSSDPKAPIASTHVLVVQRLRAAGQGPLRFPYQPLR